MKYVDDELRDVYDAPPQESSIQRSFELCFPRRHCIRMAPTYISRTLGIVFVGFQSSSIPSLLGIYF